MSADADPRNADCLSLPRGDRLGGGQIRFELEGLGLEQWNPQFAGYERRCRSRATRR